MSTAILKTRSYAIAVAGPVADVTPRAVMAAMAAAAAGSVFTAGWAAAEAVLRLLQA